MRKIISLILALAIITMPLAAFSAPQKKIEYNPNRPIIILKFDDLNTGSVNGFQVAVDECKKLDIRAGFGVVGTSFSSAQDSIFERIKRWADDGFEIWHHGYDHASAEYSTNSYDQQKESFGKTLDLFQKKAGIKITCFGSPENNATDTTLKMISENYKQIKSVFFMSGGDKYGDIVYLRNRGEFEQSVGKLHESEFLIESYQKMRNSEYIVFQGHVGIWDSKSWENFEEFVKYLKDEEGCTFMTPSEYVALLEAQKKYPDQYPKYLKVNVNGEYMDFDVPAQIIDGRTMVPFRKIFEALGASVMYDPYGKIAMAYKGTDSMKLAYGDKNIYVNSKVISSDVAPTAIDGRFLVPARIVSEAFGGFVWWDAKNYKVVIVSELCKNLPEGALEIVGADCSDYNTLSDEWVINTLDSNPDTLWSCQGVGLTLTYDLGEVKELDRIEIMWNKGSLRKEAFKLYVSDDNKNFTKVFDGEASGKTDELEPYSLKSNSARYVRIECNGNNTGNWNGIKEVVIY